MSLEQAGLAAQVIASGMMCGVIWFVQLVHYPQLGDVPGEAGREYARRNRQRTAWVVLPPMIVEAVAAVWCAVWPPAGVAPALTYVGLGLVVAAWLSTLLVQMPLHERLGREGSRPDLVGRLVASNWLRTLLWTGRALLATWMLTVAGRF
ncbi:MAG: hypothetical protein RLZZ440_1266 [Planctomycetota bacterium]